MVTLNSGNNLTFFRHTGKEFHIQHHKCKFSKFRPLYVEINEAAVRSACKQRLWFVVLYSYIRTLAIRTLMVRWRFFFFFEFSNYRVLGFLTLVFNENDGGFEKTDSWYSINCLSVKLYKLIIDNISPNVDRLNV